MNRHILKALVIKDLMEVRKNRIAVYGIIVLSVIFSVAFPLLFTQMPVFSGPEGSPQPDEVAQIVPSEILGVIDGLDSDQVGIVLFLGYLFAPLFLVIPLMIASVIAAEAFVGEKERKTLEPLLYTPATDLELFLGKVLAALVPAILFTWGNFVLYTVVANVGGWPVMQRIWFPTEIWWLLIFWISPAIALLGVSVTVIISGKVSTFMEAYQASGALVLLVILLMMGQIFGLLFLSPLVSFLLGLGLFAIDAALIWIGTGLFNRSELIARV